MDIKDGIILHNKSKKQKIKKSHRITKSKNETNTHYYGCTYKKKNKLKKKTQ